MDLSSRLIGRADRAFISKVTVYNGFPTPDDAIKDKHREIAGSMLQTLESHAASNFQFLWIGDES
jgi:hypothetical protein